MLFDNFINLGKKFRDDVKGEFGALHDDLANLSDSLKHLKETISAQGKTDQKQADINQRVTITDLQTHVPICVQTEAKRSSIEKVWRVLKSAAELVGIIAVVAYTIISYGQWEQLSDSTNFAGRQTEISRKGLNETTKNFRLEQRPWLGEQELNVDIPTGKPMRVKLNFSNFGKTPALNTHMAWQTSCEPIGAKIKIKYTEKTAADRNTVMPGQTFSSESDEEPPVCSAINLGLLRQGKASITVIGTLWYRDEFSLPHFTEFCLFTAFPLSESSKPVTQERKGAIQPCSYHNRAE